jgi:hypothetical protein
MSTNRETQTEENDTVENGSVYTDENSEEENQSEGGTEEDSIFISELKCHICRREFNRHRRLVKILVPCGHSLCSTCTERVTQCPICRNVIEENITNWVIQRELGSEEIRIDDINENIETDTDKLLKIFADYKREIETYYLNNEETHFQSNTDNKLVKKILSKMRNIEFIDEFLIDDLLIPKTLKYAIKKGIYEIKRFRNANFAFNINQLPFCP